MEEGVKLNFPRHHLVNRILKRHSPKVLSIRTRRRTKPSAIWMNEPMDIPMDIPMDSQMDLTQIPM